MKAAPSYFSNWKSETFICSECSWTGQGEELSLETFDELFETHCPKCDSKFHVIGYPTLDEVKEAAAQGNPEAQMELRKFE